ncbi:MAG: hypothetical protein E7640_01105 [Ruminococcaceae bacterium]|nr:hypothetical protein [Oscillospiraceae bacterium]
MSRETNEELYVPYKKENGERRGWAKFAAEHGAPPLINLVYTALITFGAAVVLTLILILTGLRLVNDRENGISYLGWIGRGGEPVLGILNGEWVAGGTVNDDGATYVGQMKDLKYHGNGTLTFADGTVYSGQFENGVYSGFGKLVYADGSKYEGSFKNGKFNGPGTLTYADGASYSGSFENGEFHGNGVMIYRDGAKYEGSFKNGARDTGKYTWPTGESIDGVFDNNLPSPGNMDFMSYTDADGKTYYVVIRDGLILKRLSYVPQR